MVTVTFDLKGIYGHLHYRSEDAEYRIPIEHTGDYKQGFLVFFSGIEPPIPEQDVRNVLGKVRRDLQIWAKENEQPLCW